VFSPLTKILRRAVREAAKTDEARRTFVKTAALAAAATALPPILIRCTKPQEVSVGKDFNVAVVGAGIAGLNAARYLKNGGLKVRLFEATQRTGGRILSADNLLVKGAVTELGGELIDSNHAEMLSLAREFELDLIDLQDADYATLKDTFFFDNRKITSADIANGIAPYLKTIAHDASMLPFDLRHLNKSPAQALDDMSMETYLTQLGVTGWLRRFIEVAFVTENGTELADQSALNFITLVSTELNSGAFQPYGESDERYKVRGGNQQITDMLSVEVRDGIHTGMILERIAKVGGRFQLTFRKDAAMVEEIADVVVLAIPFSILRSIEMAMELPKNLHNMIHHLNYGQNSKIVVGFRKPFWHESGANGVMFSDGPVQLAWDNTALQNVDGGGLTFFHGGSMCRAMGAVQKDKAASQMMDSIAQAWPAPAADMAVGRVERMYWPAARFVKGSYSSFGPGQWTQMYGVGATSVDGLYFAGEHTNEEFRGYMNGAALSGKTSAEKVLAAIARATF